MHLMVSHDADGIKQAAKEPMLATLTEEDRARQMENLAAGDEWPEPEQLAKLFPASRLSPGYHDWVLYLSWLEEKQAVGVRFEQITADEAEGLTALARARREFEAEHPACANCGPRQLTARVRQCRQCFKELESRVFLAVLEQRNDDLRPATEAVCSKTHSTNRCAKCLIFNERD
jgi:hypothetical protein